MADEKKEDVKPPEEEKGSPVSLMDLPNVECRCGGMIWEYGFILKRLDTKQTGPKNIPVDIVQCKKCKSILQDGIPLLKRPQE